MLWILKQAVTCTTSSTNVKHTGKSKCEITELCFFLVPYVHFLGTAIHEQTLALQNKVSLHINIT